MIRLPNQGGLLNYQQYQQQDPQGHTNPMPQENAPPSLLSYGYQPNRFLAQQLQQSFNRPGMGFQANRNIEGLLGSGSQLFRPNPANFDVQGARERMLEQFQRELTGTVDEELNRREAGSGGWSETGQRYYGVPSDGA